MHCAVRLREGCGARWCISSSAGIPFLGKDDVRSLGWHAFPLVARVIR
jgi:hypothetical protein